MRGEYATLKNLNFFRNDSLKMSKAFAEKQSRFDSKHNTASQKNWAFEHGFHKINIPQ